MAQGKKVINANILLGHTHWDHIQGFPFFSPAFVKGNSVAIYGPEGSRGSLHDVLAGQMEFTYFPIELNQLPAAITYHDLTEGIHTIRGARVATQFLNHPAMTVAQSRRRRVPTLLRQAWREGPGCFVASLKFTKYLEPIH